MESEPTVFVVDDDAYVRDGLEEVVKSIGLAVESYASAEDFLEAYDPNRPGCLILDVRMPGIDGIELQQKLKAGVIDIPIVFLTGHGDVPMAVHAVLEGAVDFIEKPFREQALLGSLKRAIDRDRESRRVRTDRAAVIARLATLSTREREVLELVVAGKLSKVIANELGLSPSTVDFHRSNILAKMQAANAADLVRMVRDAEGH
ncbi:MAG: response regulator transcription factor [Phycisphaerae bacterium]|nr:response regulator transcription factor [Phycisphaerae bacterium]